MSSEQPGSQTLSAYLFRSCDEIGLISLYYSPLDTKLLCLQRFARFIAYGCTAIILAAFLSSLGNSDGRIGLFMTLTLVGDVVISFILTLYADRLGRKAVLVIGSLLMVACGIVFGISDNFFVLLLAAIFGVISPSGNEVGPFRAVEESTLAHLTPHTARSDIFAWYTLIGYAGTAVGTISGGWVVHSVGESTEDITFAYRCAFYIYAAMGFIKFLLACGLSKNIEAEKEKSTAEDLNEHAPLLGPEGCEEIEVQEVKDKTFLSIGRENMPTYIQLCLLFGFDSFASGLATTTWLAYFLKSKFGIEEGKLGSIFSGAAVLTALSILVASAIAKRIGNVKAMVFTHLPSAVFLVLIPLQSKAGPAITFQILRACFQSMDTAPRSAFLASVILPKERTAVMGFINVIKTMTQSIGPLVTGVLASKGMFGFSFILAGILKVIYDFGVLVVFAGHKSQQQEEAPESYESEEEDRSEP